MGTSTAHRRYDLGNWMVMVWTAVAVKIFVKYFVCKSSIENYYFVVSFF